MKHHFILSTTFLFLFVFFGNPRAFAQEPAIASQATPANTDTLVNVVNLTNTPIEIVEELVSDIYFQEALASFDKENNQEAALHIRIAAQEVLKEAPKEYRKLPLRLVEHRAGELLALSLMVEAGVVKDRRVLQQHFADAGESIAHRYYESANALIDGNPEALANRLAGLSLQLRSSKEYHNAAEKGRMGGIADEAAGLATDARNGKTNGRQLEMPLRTRLKKFMEEVKTLKLEE